LQGETRRCNSVMDNAALLQNEATYITDGIPMGMFHAPPPPLKLETVSEGQKHFLSPVF